MFYNLSMEKWKKITLHKDGWPVKVYVNQDDTYCVVFPLFGKYHGVYSDVSAIDFCIEIMFHRGSDSVVPAGVCGYSQYLSSQEDTAVIFQEAA